MEPDLPINMTTTTITLSFGDFWQLGTDLQAARNDRAALTDENHTLAARIADLEKQLADALKPPPPVVIPPPVVVPPVIKPRTLTLTREVIKDLAGITIENGNSEPNAAQYALVRATLKQAAEMGFNAARWFMNEAEVKKHLTLVNATTDHLPNYARSLGMTYIADTVDSVVWSTLKEIDNPKSSPAENAKSLQDLRVYLEGLMKLGARAFVVNDANQYRDNKNADGSPLYPAGTLERIVSRIRAVTPDMPLIASLTGNADIVSYRIMPGDSKEVAAGKFNFVEAQTFGKPGELPGFLGKPFDAFVFDGRKGVTEAYLRAVQPMILAANPDAFFWYPTLASDWQTMPAQVAIIKDTVQAWHKIA